ncbi:MAG: leucine-rich repeat protein [Clostridia bacterium]|nr:leucine-rich repeat protein [Clostridia bacterium]
MARRFLCVLLALTFLISVDCSFAENWICPGCKNEATGNFCSECGTAKPVMKSPDWICPNCGNNATGNFCNNCGTKRPETSKPESIDFEEQVDGLYVHAKEDGTSIYRSPNIEDEWAKVNIDYEFLLIAKSGNWLKISSTINSFVVYALEDEFTFSSKQYETIAPTPTPTQSITPTSTPIGKITPTPSTTPNTTLSPMATPFSAEGYSDVFVKGDFSCSYVDGGIIIVRYNGNSSYISISSTIEGKKVIGIASNAFRDCQTIDSITIWPRLTSIGDYAFAGCTRLTSISIPGSVTYIGVSAFEGCSSLTSATIWSGPTVIKERAFKDCIKLTSISIPGSVKTIEPYAFYNCSALTSATFWSGIECIGESAFWGCVKLQSVSIPSSTKLIEKSAFCGCKSLNSITFWGGTNIGDYAFQGCTKLRSISISRKTEYIGNYAFEGCSSLSSVITDSYTSIGVGAFDNCPALRNKPVYPRGTVPDETSSSINGSVTPTPTVFSQNHSNQDAVSIDQTPRPTITPNVISSSLPDQYTSGNYVDGGTLMSITWELYDTGLLIISGSGYLNSDSAWSRYKARIKYIFIESGIVDIGDNLFSSYTNLEGIDIPDTVKRIGYRAFYSCEKLHEITIPGNVKEIEDYAFAYSGLTSCIIEEGATTVSDYCFYYASDLESVKLPSTLTAIGLKAFYSCEKLHEVTIPGNVKEIEDYAFAYSGLTSCIIEEGATTVSDYCFYYASSLENVELPSTLTVIGFKAFYSCDVKVITIPSTILEIGQNAFNYNDDLQIVYYQGSESEWNDVNKHNSGIQEGVIVFNNPIEVSNSSDVFTIGDMYVFGMYEQDNNKSNGKEPIEWIILDVDVDGSILLLSKYALDAQPYHTKLRDTIWATCTLRQWLNKDFLDAAFTDEEQTKIKVAKIVNNGNPFYSREGSDDTEDKVWLLSISEINEYFKEDEDRLCAPTKYAAERGVALSKRYSVDGLSACFSWWLRSPGYRHDTAATITVDLVNGEDYCAVSYGWLGVRPVIVIMP